VSAPPALDALHGLRDFVGELAGQQQQDGLRVSGISSMIRSSMAGVLMTATVCAVPARADRSEFVMQVTGYGDPPGWWIT
jgi:hypothetical protein